MSENNENNFNHGKITTTELSREMRDSFLDYSMSVIVDRALPDVRDGMKPVHRRILYAMNDLGIVADKPHKKSARIVGEVIGKYHPHGDTAVYDAMVRMAQEFSYRYPLVDGHGNFGSIDGDGAAAMRYTEARMSKISMELIRDIQKETIDWMDNYDGEEQEPVVLPAKFPNLIVNGGTGIAVGMATNMAPHNLSETVDAIIATMENPDITLMELMENYITGPDFPTGGYILGRSGIKQAYETGRGSVIMRAKSNIEQMDNGKTRIVVYEIPYNVNKANLVERIASLVRDKQIEGITDLRDESNREGIRIVIELRKDVQPEVLLNQLYRMTALQSSFGINNMVLVNKVPRLLGLKDLIQCYIDHQIEVITRRTQYDLKKAEARAHILAGLKIALDFIDEVINTIRTARDNAEALNNLMTRFNLSEIQAKAIMEMQLRRLTGLERQRIEEEYDNLMITIADLKDILANHSRVVDIIKTELLEIKAKYGDDRRSEIIEADSDMEDEDLIPVEDIVVTLTVNGYIKRLPADTYRVQNRGGKGIKGMSMNEDDIIDQFLTMSTHDNLLIFTSTGRVYRTKGYRVPNSGRTSKGLPIVNVLKLEKGESVRSLVSYKKDDEATYLFFATKHGLVKKVPIEEFESIRQNGKIAITLRENDELAFVKALNAGDEILLAGSNGKVVRFNETEVRASGRTSMGVRGFSLTFDEYVIGAATHREGSLVFTISENGYGKMSDIDDYRLSGRGTKGVKTMNVTEKTGNIAAMRVVEGNEDCMIMTDDGIIIRINLSQVSTMGRNSQGVKLISVGENTKVSEVCITKASVDPEETTEETTTEEAA